MKLYSKKEIIPILAILAILAVGLYFLPQLPGRVPTHWGINGEPNGWNSKTFTVLFFPALIAAIYILLSFIPLMDPLKKNIESFAGLYFWFKIVFVLFMAGLYCLALYAGLGHQVDIGRFVSWGIAALFFFIGLMLPKIKKNYTIGIRLPWTLHSEAVWDKTHKFGGKLFIGLAFLIVLVSFLPGGYMFGTLVTAIFLLLVVLIVYSYRSYRKLETK